MQGGFKCIEDASSEDGVVGVEYVDDIKSDVFCVRVLQSAKDTGRVMTPTGLIHFPPKL
jgi:hypothetical protein